MYGNIINKNLQFSSPKSIKREHKREIVFVASMIHFLNYRTEFREDLNSVSTLKVTLRIQFGFMWAQFKVTPTLHEAQQPNASISSTLLIGV
jgi:hypothetical protein